MRWSLSDLRKPVSGKAVLIAFWENPSAAAYKRYRFPATVSQGAVGLFGFALRLRDVEELLAPCGVDLSCETIRAWTVRFCPESTPNQCRLKPHGSPASAPASSICSMGGMGDVWGAELGGSDRTCGNAQGSVLRKLVR